jgi:hypothetical protein
MPPPPLPLFRSSGLRLERSGPGRLCLRATDLGLLFDVETRRLVGVRALPDPSDPGRAVIQLAGALQPYGFRSVDEAGAQFGPLPAAEVEALLPALLQAAGPPARPLAVDVHYLKQTPERFHQTMIVATGPWARGMELSDFAGAWLDRPAGMPRPASSGPGVETTTIEVVGLWQCEPRRDPRTAGPGAGYGHMGMSRAGLEAASIRFL